MHVFWQKDAASCAHVCGCQRRIMTMGKTLKVVSQSSCASITNSPLLIYGCGLARISISQQSTRVSACVTCGLPHGGVWLLYRWQRQNHCTVRQAGETSNAGGRGTTKAATNFSDDNYVAKEARARLPRDKRNFDHNDTLSISRQWSPLFSRQGSHRMVDCNVADSSSSNADAPTNTSIRKQQQTTTMDHSGCCYIVPFYKACICSMKALRLPKLAVPATATTATWW